MNCKNCKFFKPTKLNKAVGSCRRFPPIQDGNSVHTIDEFPTVRQDCWCGEHKKGAKK